MVFSAGHAKFTISVSHLNAGRTRRQNLLSVLCHSWHGRLRRQGEGRGRKCDIQIQIAIVISINIFIYSWLWVCLSASRAKNVFSFRRKEERKKARHGKPPVFSPDNCLFSFNFNMKSWKILFWLCQTNQKFVLKRKAIFYSPPAASWVSSEASHPRDDRHLPLSLEVPFPS